MFNLNFIKNQNNSKKILISLFLLFIIIVILLLAKGCYEQRNLDYMNTKIDEYRKQSIPILESVWNHYITHENFEGDWWSGKFRHPKMIDDDGAPYAFMDSLDIDMNGIADINWSDPSAPFELIVVSESSSYALFRAIWSKDKKTFDKVWKWTKDNLQRNQLEYIYQWIDVDHPDNGWVKPKDIGLDADNLFAWRWVPSVADPTGKGRNGVMYYRWKPATEEHNPNYPWRDGYDVASDADQDIALSLIYANSLWGSNKGDRYLDYEQNARDILKDLWDKVTFVNNEYRYFAGGDNITDIEPGYLSPFSYRIFNDFDSERDWNSLIESSYRVFNESSTMPLSSWTDKRGVVHSQDPTRKQRWPRANLIPDWVNVDKDGNFRDGQQREEPEYGTDAFRALWRIAVDYEWYKDENAKEYLRKNSPYGPYNFLTFRLNDNKGDWDKTQDYDESNKLASVYWHDGSYALYESNYEPDFNENYIINAHNSRANIAQYGTYLSYFWGSYLVDPNPKTFSSLEKLLYPLITPEADGFSKRKYTIPDDQLEFESPENLAKHIPADESDPTLYIGTPYSDGDGWYSESSSGGYWTVFDHSEWNAQMDYFSSTWAWFGLGHFAGVVKNFYEHNNKEPQLNRFELYSDKDFNYLISKNDPIVTDVVYVRAYGKDKNPDRRDFFYFIIKTSLNEDPIEVKLAETNKDSGIFTGKFNIGLKSSNGGDVIAASVGTEITLIAKHQKTIKDTYKVGRVIISSIVENFEDGSYNDANPMAWWTDSIFPSSGRPDFTEPGIYIWKDTQWRIRFFAGDSAEVFHGMILTDGQIVSARSVDIEKTDHFKKHRRSIDLSFTEISGQDGVDFIVDGTYVIFDIKRNGVYDLNAFKIGAEGLSSFGAPLVLRNIGKTGSYSYSINNSIAYNSNYSLQIDKQYIGKDYPYLGGVIFNENHRDWTEFDEFEFDVYLKEDIGTIRVDIQDIDGTVAILNGYNPWDNAKGAGWYKWKSNNQFGVDINANLVQPYPIRYRNWWRGWSFDEGRNIDRTEDIDLSSIYNVMFCIDGGNKKATQIIVDNFRLVKENYYYGYNKPKRIYDIELFLDKNYSQPINDNEVLQQDMLYIQVTGKDSSKDSIDRFNITIETSDEHPGCQDLQLEVVETDVNSGIYRGSLRLGVYSDFSQRLIGASAGNTIKVYSDVRTRLSKTIYLGEFDIKIILDDFDDIASGISPSSWWVDSIDPTDGRPIYPAGRQLGYFLWKEKDTWFLRWSSNQETNHFTGTLKSDGTINVVEKYNLQEGDFIIQDNPRHLRLNTYEKYAEDGINFKIDGSFVEFDLLINEEKYPQLAFVGPNEWNKAYTIPFIVKNYGRTKSYELMITNKRYLSFPNSMRIVKNYFSKDYPYLGKWGLSGDLSKWDDKNEFTFWIYLPENVGDIQVDLEDGNRQVAILNAYNPYNSNIGPGWYKWSSMYPSGKATSLRAIDNKPIKDRTFWKAYDTTEEKLIDVTTSFNIENILNLEISIGGGEKKDSVVYVDDMHLIRGNKHVGFTNPLNINYIKLYNDKNFTDEIIGTINSQEVFVEIKGKDGDKYSKDKINVTIFTDDDVVNINSIIVPLDETNTNTGIYRGSFFTGLDTYPDDNIIGAPWQRTITIVPPIQKQKEVKFFVGEFDLIYIIDDFSDGSISDQYPVTWWISGTKEEDKSYILDVQENKKDNSNYLNVLKRYRGDNYPYFGAWGLVGRFSDWNNKDDFIIEMYLYDNPGELKVDIEDQSGVKAVLNGYSPWSSEKGPGVYNWIASLGKGSDVRNRLVEPKKIRERAFWYGWNDRTQRYTDVTKTFDFSSVRNVQFLLDPEGSIDKNIDIYKIYTIGKNYRSGNSKPLSIKEINFYHDPQYSIKIKKDDNIQYKHLYVELIGEDADPLRLDSFDTTIMLYPLEKDYYPVDVRLYENNLNSGTYRGMIDLGTVYSPMTLEYIKVQDRLALEYDTEVQSRKYIILSLLEFDSSSYDDFLKRKTIIAIFKYLLLLLLLIALTTYVIIKKKKKNKYKR
jgi:endo-1,4-beta-D-glucanase Y